MIVLNLAEKLDIIFGVLGCSNAEIARISGIDPSLVSRFRSGSRQPRPTSSQFISFCNGILAYANEKGLGKKLHYACQLPGSKNPEAEMISYLSAKETEAKIKPSGKNLEHPSFTLFSEKLNALMSTLDISNVRLARALNIDTSLVSRFRNGLRIPQKNSPLMESLCSYFYKTARINGLEYELSELLGISVASVESGGDDLTALFTCWLSDQNEMQNTGAMDSFLGKLDNLSIATAPALPALGSIITADILQDISNEYMGIDGIRRAVIRFLGTVAMSGKTHTLKLYSDQSMDWLSSDPVFVQKWTALMHAVLINKNTVKVIHNINRNLAEMLVGIEKWLPLYMSGLIEGYYFKSPSCERFSHTLFVTPETAAIQASIVSGTEDDGHYHYACTQDRVEYYEKQMDALLKISKPLIHVFKKNSISGYHFCTGEMSKAPGHLKRLLLSPSLAAMPAVLLERILDRTETDERESILAFHEVQAKQFERELKNGRVTEYIIFPDDGALFSGKAALNLYDVFAENIVAYTPEEFSEHIESIISMLENSSYDIVPLTCSPFANIQMAVKEDTCAIVQKTDQPVTAFRFSHPLMCRAVGEYIDVFGQRSRLNINSKGELIKYLGKYLR